MQEREKELLQKIDLNISGATWERYDYLVNLRRQEKLTSDEHATLIKISDRIEEANAEQMKHLMELAKIRGVSLREIMDSLGIKPREAGESHAL